MPTQAVLRDGIKGFVRSNHPVGDQTLQGGANNLVAAGGRRDRPRTDGVALPVQDLPYRHCGDRPRGWNTDSTIDGVVAVWRFQLANEIQNGIFGAWQRRKHRNQKTDRQHNVEQKGAPRWFL